MLKLPKNGKRGQPFFYFYPNDWLRDINLQVCSLEAKGLWIQLLCLMHECEPYGYLAIDEQPIPDEKVALLVGVNIDKYRCILSELLCNKVIKITEKDIYFSARMVRDMYLKTIKSQSGQVGGKQRVANITQAKLKQSSSKAQADGQAKFKQMVKQTHDNDNEYDIIPLGIMNMKCEKTPKKYTLILCI